MKTRLPFNTPWFKICCVCKWEWMCFSALCYSRKTLDKPTKAIPKYSEGFSKPVRSTMLIVLPWENSAGKIYHVFPSCIRWNSRDCNCPFIAINCNIDRFFLVKPRLLSKYSPINQLFNNSNITNMFYSLSKSSIVKQRSISVQIAIMLVY